MNIELERRKLIHFEARNLTFLPNIPPNPAFSCFFASAAFFFTHASSFFAEPFAESSSYNEPIIMSGFECNWKQNCLARIICTGGISSRVEREERIQS